MTQDDPKTPELRETCSFACEIDLTGILEGRDAGEVHMVQSAGTLRLIVQGDGKRDIEMEISDKPGDPRTKIHKYRFKRY